MSDSNSREAGMRRLQNADFALIEANLYLDTHPRCQNGLDYFRRMRAEKNRALQDFESRYGPITAANANAERQWDWLNRPWPWEMED